MNPLATLLFSLAKRVAPKADKFWIDDIWLEASFVPNKLRFALTALRLAFTFRFTTLKINRPATLVFASVALAAVAMFLVVPTLFRATPTTTADMLPTVSYETANDVATASEYSADAQEVALAAPAATRLNNAQSAASQPSATSQQAPQAEIPADLAQTAPATSPAVTEPTTQAPIEPATTAEADSSLSPAAESSALSAAPPETELTQAPFLLVPAAKTPDVDSQVISTLVRGQSVKLEVLADTLLTLYRDTNFSGSPRLHRYVKVGETFSANAPFSLYTDNAAALQITADGKTLSLGEKNEEQFRIFSEP